VVTDQKSSSVAPELELADSPIENELPAYRAISGWAVFSVLCGALAVFSFAHPFFYLFPLLSLAAGIWANLTIKRYPDILTGRRLANGGIALGLVFGLAAATIVTVQSFVRTREAKRFARTYEEALAAPSYAKALWYNIYPAQRKAKSEQDALREFEAAKGKERMAIDQKMGGFLKIRRRLAASPGQELRFVDIEGIGEDETHGGNLNLFAYAVYQIRGPESTEFPEKEQFALAVFKGTPKGRQYEWWVDELFFPYKPKSYVAPEKAPDDGHGHAH
jgi:hypothetical protein